MTAYGLPEIAQLGTIAAIWAHPDDETYLSGGIMAAAVASGQRVVCVSATAGEHGTDDPVAWPPERLGRIRRWEANAAMAILGVRDHRFLDLPDGGLAALDPTEPVKRIAELLTEVAPDTVLTFGPDGTTFHPDHVTLSRWVEEAWRLAGCPGALLQTVFTDEHLAAWGPSYEDWAIYMSDERPVGVPVQALAVHLKLEGELLDRKVAALCAMHTQIAPALALLGPEAFRAMNEVETFVAVPA